MSFKNIKQPNEIFIDKDLKLVTPTTEDFNLALQWYSNKDVLYYSEGEDAKPYNIDKITKMYQYLNSIGELYFIYCLENNKWVAIGDVTLSDKNLPIAIGDPKYFSKGIGKKVIAVLLERAKNIGLCTIYIPSIFKYNIRSRRLFEHFGFKKYKETEIDFSYVYIVMQAQN